VSSPIARLLRQHTRDMHERVEASLGLLDPGLTAARLCDVLGRLAGFWAGTERAVDGWALDHPVPAGQLHWARRRRVEILRHDLLRLGMSRAAIADLPTAPTAFAPGPVTDADVLGWLYVAEGSTLGGAVIDRTRVPGSPMARVRALRPYPEGPGPMWREYLGYLRGWVGDDAERRDAVLAAGEASFLALADWLAPIAVGVST
jgi:heme oxygenase